jgi:hypothetical protein
MSGMFWPFKKSRLRAAQEAAAQSARQQLLRSRLLETLHSAARVLIDENDFEGETADKIWRDVDRVRTGIDLVLVEGLDAYSGDISDTLRGGAVIAQSADALSHAASALGNTELEQTIGSVRDAETIGHIFFQLGFERDGNLRQAHPA